MNHFLKLKKIKNQKLKFRKKNRPLNRFWNNKNQGGYINKTNDSQS